MSVFQRKRYLKCIIFETILQGKDGLRVIDTACTAYPQAYPRSHPQNLGISAKAEKAGKIKWKKDVFSSR